MVGNITRHRGHLRSNRTGHARCPVQRRTEVVKTADLRLASADPHAHRQLEPTLRINGRIDRGIRRRERRTDAVASVLHHPTVASVNSGGQHLIMGGERRAHRRRVLLPPSSRPHDVSEQERHSPHRSFAHTSSLALVGVTPS